MITPDPNLADLLIANHILSRHGVVDAFGHVSVRDSLHPDQAWNPSSQEPA